MFRPRRLLWLVLVAGISYTIWRWRQSQANALNVPVMSPAPQTPGPAAAPGDAPTPSSGPRRIATRVHRGAPPSVPISPAPAAAPAAGPDEPPPAPSEPPATHEQSVAPLTPEEAVSSHAEPEPPATHEQSIAPLTPEEAVEAHDEPSLGAAAEPPPAAPVNINDAELQTLIDLPGIGPALATRIVAHRDEHGPFTSVEQLVDIQGIGRVSLNEFRHLITV